MRHTNWIALVLLFLIAGLAAAQSPILAPPSLGAPANPAPPPSPAPAALPARPGVPAPATEYGSGLPTMPPNDPLIGDVPAPPPVIFTHAPERLWIDVGILLGWSERANLPASLNVPSSGSTIGFLQHHNNTDLQAGLILNGGFWFDDNQKHGIDVNFYNTGDWYQQYDPTVLNTPIGQFNQGNATIDTEFASVDVNYRHQLFKADNFRLYGLIGYRYARLWESTDVGTIISDPDFGAVQFRDHARTTNDFNGGQLGVATEWKAGLWTFNAAGKVALGGVHEEASFDGASALAIANGAPGVIPNLSTTQFAVLPSASLMLSRQLWSHSRVYLGYEFQYLSRVVRSNDVFEALGTGQPVKANSSFWSQGVTLGYEWRY